MTVGSLDILGFPVQVVVGLRVTLVTLEAGYLVTADFLVKELQGSLVTAGFWVYRVTQVTVEILVAAGIQDSRVTPDFLGTQDSAVCQATADFLGTVGSRAILLN